MKMTCSNCAGRSDEPVRRRAGMELISTCYICTQRDSDKWNKLVTADDTCLDWEPEKEAGHDSVD